MSENEKGGLLAKTNKKEKLIISIVGGVIILFALVGLKEITAERAPAWLSAPLAFGVICSILSVYRFCRKQAENPFASVFRTLKDDYVFDKYVTFQLFNIIYAIGLGLGVGSSFGFFVDWLHASLTRAYWPPSWVFLIGAVLCLFFIVLLRIALETSAIIYKAAIEFRTYVKEKMN